MLRRSLPVVTTALIVSLASPASAIIPPDTQCRTGKVSITFDDGPSKANTPRLLKILRANHAQATFFVQGQNARRYPKILRAAISDGHAVENHSWDHPMLTSRPDRSVKRQLKLTQRAIRRAIGQEPGLFRPPYGDTSKHVRAIARRYHLKQELWTIDTKDWTGRSRKGIRRAALRGLRPHRSNVILMHDAVGNSPTTLKAVPSIIQRIRHKGYCLVPLEEMMPLDQVAAKDVVVDEGVATATTVPVTLTLGGPAQRNGSLRVRTVPGSARAGKDFAALARRVHVHRGDTSVTIALTIHADAVLDATRSFTLALDQPRDLALSTPSVRITIRDDAPWAEETAALIAPSTGPLARLAP